ncbi:MAG TPA: helix-turn-helix transcriptional regulator [Ramlibacter sp.]|nr:helix-turn-helix transcriptional regulator [Ramlibacter sp.]
MDTHGIQEQGFASFGQAGLFDCAWLACEGALAQYCRALLVVDVAPRPPLDLTIVPHDSSVVSLQLAAGADPLARGIAPEMLPHGCGWRETAHTYRPVGDCRSFFALLTPEGALQLLGGQAMVPGAVPRQPLAHWLPAAALRLLVDRLALETDPRLQLRLFGEWLEGRMVRQAVVPWQARRASRVLSSVLQSGRAEIEEVARAEGVSRRQLERDLRRWFDTTPKQASLIGRVQAAARLGLQGHALADIAYRLGFVDQSHMTHVVRRLAGVTPAQMVRSAQTELSSALRAATGGGLVYL